MILLSKIQFPIVMFGLFDSITIWCTEWMVANGQLKVEKDTISSMQFLATQPRLAIDHTQYCYSCLDRLYYDNISFYNVNNANLFLFITSTASHCN